jgi:hypothetical protein
MERREYFAHTKGRLAQWARSTALAIVPLATAVTAHAVALPPMLPSGNFVCTQQGTSANSCSANDTPLVSPGLQVSGVSFYTTGDGIDIALSDGASSATVTMSAGGTLNETLSRNVPVFWDFTLAEDGSTQIESWNLSFDLGTGVGDSTYGSFSTSANPSGPGSFVGNGIVTVGTSVPASSTIYETVVLAVTTNGGTGDVFITAPFNFGSAPEPASFGLLGAGLGILAWLGRRRKAA